MSQQLAHLQAEAEAERARARADSRNREGQIAYLESLKRQGGRM